MPSTFTTADLAAVRAAMLRGERIVKFADREVTYRSMAELVQLEDRIRAELAETTSQPKQFFPVTSKGL